MYKRGDTEAFSKEWWGKPFEDVNADFELGSMPDEVRILFRWIKGTHEIPKAEFTDLVIHANAILKKIKA